MTEPITSEPLIESVKFASDAYKHTSTLNAGSIVLIGTFLTDIFPSAHGTLDVGWFIKFLIAGSFVAFGLSLAYSLLNIYIYLVLLEEKVHSPTELRAGMRRRIKTRDKAVPLLSTFAGLTLFGIAVLVNMFM